MLDLSLDTPTWEARAVTLDPSYMGCVANSGSEDSYFKIGGKTSDAASNPFYVGLDQYDIAQDQWTVMTGATLATEVKRIVFLRSTSTL